MPDYPVALPNAYYPGPEQKEFRGEIVWFAGSMEPTKKGSYLCAIYRHAWQGSTKTLLDLGILEWDGARWRKLNGYGADQPDFWCENPVPDEKLSWRTVRNA